jgi:hypothetical protein
MKTRTSGGILNELLQSLPGSLCSAAVCVVDGAGRFRRFFGQQISGVPFLERPRDKRLDLLIGYVLKGSETLASQSLSREGGQHT